MEISQNSLTKSGVQIWFPPEDKGLTIGMRAYANSTSGRVQLESECTSDVVKEVYDTWGSTPTVTEPTYPTPPAPQPTAEQKQLAAMALQQAQQATTITALQQANAALMLKLAGGK